jgi:hypothetical protein
VIVFDPYQNFTQSPKFAIPRQYLGGIEVGNTWDGISMTGNVITLFGHAPFLYYNIFVIRTNVVAWSSNRYTLDYVLEDHWSNVPPSPSHDPFYVTTEYLGAGAGLPGRVLLRLPGYDIQRAFFPLPPSPADYWMNNGS